MARGESRPHERQGAEAVNQPPVSHHWLVTIFFDLVVGLIVLGWLFVYAILTISAIVFLAWAGTEHFTITFIFFAAWLVGWHNRVRIDKERENERPSVAS